MIYTVELSIKMVVDADHPDHAEDIAKANIHSADKESFDCWADPRPLENVKDIPEGWDGKCLPYGRIDNKRLDQILSPNDELWHVVSDEGANGVDHKRLVMVLV